MRQATRSSQRGLVSPRLTSAGGTCHAEASRSRGVGGFTLIEIMIVVTIVAILSSLAMVAIGRIRDHAIHTMLQNNLRQLYQAKEFYVAETGVGSNFWAGVLVDQGYFSKSQYARMFGGDHGMEAKSGWHYSRLLMPGAPTQAYRGPKPAPDAPASKDIMYYPAPSANVSAPTGQAQQPTSVPTPIIAPTATPQATPAQVPPPVVVAPPQPPQSTPTLVTPPATTSSNSGTPATGATGNPPANPHGPGNSDFGHSHGQGNPNSHGNHGNKP